MATTFTYRGLDESGRAVRGTLAAEDAAQATTALKARAIYPTTLTATSGPVSAGAGSGRGLAGPVAVLTRQLATLVAGGVPLMSAFAALTAHTENPRLRAVLGQMRDAVHGGQALWEALAAHPAVFPSLYVSMVKAGEASGQLATVLNWLAAYLEQEQARRLQLRGALAYPTLLVVAGTLAITLLLVGVVPKFAGMFAEFDQALPLPTIILLAVANFLGHWGWTLPVGGVLLVGGLSQYARTPAGRLRVDGWRLKLPLFGKLQWKAAMARFAMTTATLLRGGVPLLDALAVVREVLDNAVLARATDQAREGMREGERFAERLQATGVFPAFLTHMVGIGEETGDLQSLLTTVAHTYDLDVETTLKSLVSLVEPVIIITVGGIMGCIILSMLLPIFQIDLLGS